MVKTYLNSANLGLDLYPQMFLAPDGRVFNSGPSTTTRYLDTAGTGSWSQVPSSGRAGPTRDYGSAVMYAPGKILVMGGGGGAANGPPPETSAQVIDLNQTSPSWSFVGSMHFARRQMNATLLPDGKVLATGGTSTPGFNDPTVAVYAAELWDPAKPMQWTTLASSLPIPRVYHSTAVLLPDGRVLSMGGNGDPQRNSEIYSPPYLFNVDGTPATRPRITSAPPASPTDRPSSSQYVRRHTNCKGHDAETLLGDPCFQHEPVHQHVDKGIESLSRNFRRSLEASTLGSFRSRC